ncbi:MAG: hypothetical protein H6R23_1453 [Proteobacteria bacterium]|nr:hypothetical protein [Pseudomonadota bacterium]
MIGQQPRGAQIDVARAVQTAPPQFRHPGDGGGGIAELAAQAVLGAAVDDALGADGLTGAEPLVFDQQRAVTVLAQPGQQPQASDAATDDGDIDVQSRIQWSHGRRRIRAMVLVVEQPSM